MPPLIVCQTIGRIFRRAKNLNKLKLDTAHYTPFAHDFLRDAVHCRKLCLVTNDFDPHTIAFLINGDGNGAGGKLKHLDLSLRDAYDFRDLLELIDLSLLDSCHVCPADKTVHDLVHQFAENKGPKSLWMAGFRDLGDFASLLASSLKGNDKIEELELSARDFTGDLELQRQFINDTLGSMPRPKSWKITIWGWKAWKAWNAQKSRSNRDPPKRPPLKEWNEWVLPHVVESDRIQEIETAEELVDVQDVLLFNKQWRGLFRCQDELSSGVWSPALSRIKRVGLMFRVLREVPNLFVQRAAEAEAHQLPCFVVPHHPDCPGCHKRRKQQVSESR